ncbi:unnamed protein product [Thelazia callipaeda]|uniref:Galectin n=1 Tax=Thelazia callipaeda TaxID=103827 RepID=A0A0N5CYB4_THECL|nr:unnamed protein product [Thelazia callipaeda]
MSCCCCASTFLILSAFFLITSDAKRAVNARGYSQIDKDGYMKITVEDTIHVGEQIRFLGRHFKKPKLKSFDIIQIGYLKKDERLELSHGGGKFLPKHPFWFDRKNYLMSLRILHWIFEKKVVVTAVNYNQSNYKAIGLFTEPIEYWYTDENYYIEIIYLIGHMKDANSKSEHRFYIQGKLQTKYNRLVNPTDMFNYKPHISDIPVLQNTIEAYRNYISTIDDEPMHGELDELSLETMGIPIPYHATFGPGGFGLGQQAIFSGFFDSANPTIEVKTTNSSYTILFDDKGVYFLDRMILFNRSRHEDNLQIIHTISVTNTGESLMIAYNVPHRFNYKFVYRSTLKTKTITIGITWDGPITKMIFAPMINTGSPKGLVRHEKDYGKSPFFQRVDIDNEWSQAENSIA